ncbi:Nrap protein, partial [Piedraia hortae CBS 480.64]
MSANKRRKVEHVSDEEMSFASFIDEDSRESSGTDIRSDGSVQNDKREGLKAENSNGAAKKAPPRHNPQKLAAESLAAVGKFKSNTFKLQIDKLLEQIAPRRAKREQAAEGALKELRNAIEQLPKQDPKVVDEAERQLFKSGKIAIPFPSPSPPKNAELKLEVGKPAKINVTGSYVHRTASRSNSLLEIDMMVQMPPSLFREQNVKNYRYFYRRAYYVACLAATLTQKLSYGYKMQYEYFRGDMLKPIITVCPAEEKDKKAHSWKTNIIPCIGEDVFPKEKLYPDRACIRQGEGDAQPSPFYNSSLRADMLMTSYLKLLHKIVASCDAFRPACLLGSTWLKQRGFTSNVAHGGFGNFEWSVLIALLLTGGGPGDRLILSPSHSSYQIFKAVLQILAKKDASKQVIFASGGVVPPKVDGLPVIWDGARGHNVLYKMTEWSFVQLQQEARTTIAMLSDEAFDSFDACFIVKSSIDEMRYDYSFELAASTIPPSMYGKLYSTLKKGLGDRVSLIAIAPPPSPSWQFGSAKPTIHASSVVWVGLVVSPDSIDRTVDHGPSAEQKEEAAKFRKFWGERAELRRFKDGSITESLIWNGKEPIVEQIVRFLIKKHVDPAAEKKMKFHGQQFAKLLPHGSSLKTFQPLMEACKQLEADIRALENLPLTVRQIMPADAQLRFASVNPPNRGSPPADVTIQFEASARWPDELAAIQRTKIAFLLDISRRLEKDSVGRLRSRVGLENGDSGILNQGFLDVTYESGLSFRIRIHHDREQSLLERRLKDKTLSPTLRESTATALSLYKRTYLKTPSHTQAITRLCHRFSALSGAIRLFKKWLSSHLLTNHLRDEVAELLVLKVFIHPWPYPIPSTPQIGFLRTLQFLSIWDWRTEPLIVPLGDTPHDPTPAQSNFEAWRNLDPNLNRIVLFAASSLDPDGITYTDGRPIRPVAGRITDLARAACRAVEVGEGGVAFASSVRDYDFVIYLSCPGEEERKYKNVKGGVDYASLRGEFLKEIEGVYEGLLVFFAGEERIAALWVPHAVESRMWKVSLPFSTVPEGEGMVGVNKDGVVNEIARLGGTLVERIEVLGGE